MTERRWTKAGGIGLLSCGAMTLGLQSMLSLQSTAGLFLSVRSWLKLVTLLGGEQVSPPIGDVLQCQIPFLPLLIITACLMTFAGGLSALLLRRQERSTELPRVLTSAAYWWFIPGLWEVANTVLLLTGLGFASELLMSQAPYTIGLALSGWIATLISGVLARRVDSADASQSREQSADAARHTPSRKPLVIVATAALLYAVVFTVLNWQLYWSLNIPHGDTAMYEEHLWNLLHGKGFRSYLDQGLFLGEHVQVIHLALLPLYVLWPSHLLLELCQSTALASGAFPVFWMAARVSRTQRVAVFAALAYLLYPPMQFLDIAIDYKSFRPEAFFIPLLLFALDQFERGRQKTTLVLFITSLTVKEDYTLILGPLGLWIAFRPWLGHWLREDANQLPPMMRDRKAVLFHGPGLTVFSVVWLLLSTRIVMPYFRGGEELHYVSYFAKFGHSFGEVVKNMLTRPDLLLSELCTTTSFLYVMALFAPLAFLPLLSPTRLLVAAPTIVLLCLNEIVKTDPFPRHHFQAPVVPVLIWAAIGALRRPAPPVLKWLERCWSKLRSRLSRGIVNTTSCATSSEPLFLAALLAGMSLMASVSDSLGPLSLRFHDPGSRAYWRTKYVPGPRASSFPLVFEQIPMTARVASTDFIHPRFTHFERSYDYSRFRRKVANYEDRVPDDTEFIVLDIRQDYSDIQHPRQVRELRLEPEKWELLPDRTDGYFVLLKRR